MIMSTPPNWLRGSVIADQIYQKRGRTEKLCTARPPKRHERYFPTCLKTRFPLLLKSHQMVLPRKIMRVLSFTVSCYFFLETSYPIFWWAARESFFLLVFKRIDTVPASTTLFMSYTHNCPIIKPWVVKFYEHSYVIGPENKEKKNEDDTPRNEPCPLPTTFNSSRKSALFSLLLLIFFLLNDSWSSCIGVSRRGVVKVKKSHTHP